MRTRLAVKFFVSIVSILAIFFFGWKYARLSVEKENLARELEHQKFIRIVEPEMSKFINYSSNNKWVEYGEKKLKDVSYACWPFIGPSEEVESGLVDVECNIEGNKEQKGEYPVDIIGKKIQLTFTGHTADSVRKWLEELKKKNYDSGTDYLEKHIAIKTHITLEFRRIAFCELRKEQGYPCDAYAQRIFDNEPLLIMGRYLPNPILYEFPQDKK